MAAITVNRITATTRGKEPVFAYIKRNPLVADLAVRLTREVAGTSMTAYHKRINAIADRNGFGSVELYDAMVSYGRRSGYATAR